MEVFIAYTKDSAFKDLQRSLEGWECVQKCTPIAVEVPVKKYELLRRVTAENMAKGNYILADLGCVPNSELLIKEIEDQFRSNDVLGMIEFAPEGSVRACRKGIVEKWPTNRTGLYQQEHHQAYANEGYLVIQCPTLSYRRPDVH